MKQTYDDQCIFCQIANGKVPTHMVYEDDVVAAFLDSSQVTKGHTLIVPKIHYSWLFDYEEEDASVIFSRVPKVAKALRAAFPDMTGLNVLNNNGKDAFQSVMHSHIHLIPRYSRNEDGFGLKWQAHDFGEISDEEFEEIAEPIRKQFRS